MEQTTAPEAPLATPLNPQEVLQKILEGLGIPATIEQSVVEGAPYLHITTPDPGRLIGKQGQTLSSLQFLVNRILQRKDLNAPRVTVDCEHYRNRQEDDKLKEVIEVGDRVRRWGDPAKIGPYAAAERQTIQEHFARDFELEAVTDAGDEAEKQMMTIRIRPRMQTPPPRSTR